MKRLIVCLMGICVCVPAQAQWKNLWKASKHVPQSALTARVQVQLERAGLMPAAQVRRKFRLLRKRNCTGAAALPTTSIKRKPDSKK